MGLAPVTLEGEHVRLEPLSLDHHAGLAEVGCDEAIWRWNPRFVVRTAEDMRAYIESALQTQVAGGEGRVGGEAALTAPSPTLPRSHKDAHGGGSRIWVARKCSLPRRHLSADGGGSGRGRPI